MYYIISNSDGDTTVNEITEEELIKRLNEKYYGDVGFINKIEESDTNYWREDILIIKGKIITPKPKKIVESYEV